MPYTILSESLGKKVIYSGNDWAKLLGEAYDKGWRPEVTRTEWVSERTGVIVTYEAALAMNDRDALALAKTLDPTKHSELIEILKAGLISLL